MTVKRYGQIIHNGVMEPMSDGNYVTYSDYQKLVAENAALKVANAEGQKWDGEQWIGLSIETPATDADITEIKAQGVDEYAQAFSENTNMDFACNRGFYNGALDFAANLRAGVKS